MNNNLNQEDVPRNRTTVAVILLVVGVIALLANITQSSVLGLLMLPALGLLFLGLGVTTHRFGFIIPGGILTGLGIATFLSIQVFTPGDQETGGVVVLGLGLGFLVIPVFGHFMSEPRGNHVWAFVPGIILGLIGLALFAGDAGLNLLSALGQIWPVILLAIGLYLLLWPRKRIQ